MIDFEMFSEKMRGNQAVIQKILLLFISQYEDFSQTIAAAHSANDCDAIFNIAHKLKGSASTICKVEDLQFIADIENTAREGTLPEKATLDDLSATVASMLTTIREYLDKNS